jgi:hypothetical protein
MTEDERIEWAKREMFGDKVDLARHQIVGSTISETLRISLPVLADPDRLANLPPPWTENRDMIVRLFSPILDRSRTCPGKDKRSCCHASENQTCFPKWRERKDPEWYAQQINIHLSMVNGRIGQNGPLVPALAADEAFELGQLFAEALIKFRWDKHAKRGLKTLKSAKIGGENRRVPRLSPSEIAAAVDAYVTAGKPKMAAYSLVAGEQRVSAETIRNDCRRAKNHC